MLPFAYKFTYIHHNQHPSVLCWSGLLATTPSPRSVGSTQRLLFVTDSYQLPLNLLVLLAKIHWILSKKLPNCLGAFQKFVTIKGIASYEVTEAFASAEILTMKKNSEGYLEKDEN